MKRTFIFSIALFFGIPLIKAMDIFQNKTSNGSWVVSQELTDRALLTRDFGDYSVHKILPEVNKKLDDQIAKNKNEEEEKEKKIILIDSNLLIHLINQAVDQASEIDNKALTNFSSSCDCYLPMYRPNSCLYLKALKNIVNHHKNCQKSVHIFKKLFLNGYCDVTSEELNRGFDQVCDGCEKKIDDLLSEFLNIEVDQNELIEAISIFEKVKTVKLQMVEKMIKIKKINKNAYKKNGNGNGKKGNGGVSKILSLLKNRF